MIHLSLRLALSTVKRVVATVGAILTDGDEVLLTQAGDAIITQSGNFIVKQDEVLTAQNGFLLLTQDDEVIELS